MRQVDLSAEVARLRELGSDFEDLHSEVRSLTLTPGTDARQQITSKIMVINELVRRALEHLDVLDGSQYTTVPGSRPSLEALAAIVSTASFAASDLASALFSNPLEAAASPGPPADERAVRKARHAKAMPVMPKHLADAARQLNLTYTGCHYLANGINGDVKRHSKRQRAPTEPSISDSQYDTLLRLSQGGGSLYDMRYGVSKAVDQNGKTVNLATLNALTKRGLVQVDTSTSLFQGQLLDVTADGQRALAQHKPGTTPARSVAKAPASAKPATRRTR
ncbi:hypothetical protein ACIF80_30775 [Streptomyces sp. NPDC085927]|uniref:hypothetical protein n=1 Tax=Streptomyces sp. NPDC085927 TaxID=3365738 RepID=UPI0037D6EE7B